MNTRAYSPLIPTLATLTAIFLALPALIVVYYAFNPAGLLIFPPKTLTLHWFANFFAAQNFRRALANSLGIAALVTPITLSIAIPTAIALVRHDFPGRALLNALILSPLIIPGVVTGVAFLAFFTWTGLAGGFWRITLAMICFTLPFAVRALVGTLHGLNPALEEAARNLGARPLQAFRAITLPLLYPGLLAGGIFVFVEAIDNFSIAAFLTDLRTSTLPVEAYGYIRDFDDPTTAALATLLIAQTLLLVFILQRFIGMDRFLDLRQ